MNWKEEFQPVIDRLESWYDAALANLPNAIVALVVMLAFGLVSKLVAKATERGVGRVSHSQAITNLLTAIARTLVVAIGVVVALGVLELQDAIFSLLAGAGVVGLALGFAFQDVASNLIAGVYMGLRRPFVIGDLVETADTFGTVKRINLRNTIVEAFDGSRVIIPNRTVFENPLVNHTTTPQRRITIPVGVAYETDLERAVKVGEEAVSALDFVLDDPPVTVLAREFGASSIDLDVRLWIDATGDVDWLTARHRALLAIAAAFRDEGIEIPYPIRTLDLDRARGVLVDDWSESLGEQLAARGSDGSEAVAGSDARNGHAAGEED